MIDSVKYTAPWTAQIPLYIEDGLVLYEYACHEGNWAVHNILSGGRAEDQAAATGGRLVGDELEIVSLTPAAR